MQSLDVFLSRLLPQVQGCPDITARQALLDACIEFCEETLLVQSTSAPQPATAGVSTYTMTLPSPSQQAIASVTKVWYGTALLNPVALADVADVLAFVPSAGGTSATLGAPTVYFETSPGVISLYPTPATTAADMVTARLASKPSRTATSVEDILYTDWAEGIVGGAIGRLCETPGQAYSNPALAASGYAKFWRDVSKATNLAKYGRVPAVTRVVQRSFA